MTKDLRIPMEDNEGVPAFASLSGRFMWRLLKPGRDGLPVTEDQLCEGTPPMSAKDDRSRSRTSPRLGRDLPGRPG